MIKRMISSIIVTVMLMSVSVSAKTINTTILPESGKLDFSKSDIKKEKYKYEFITIDHIEYCRKIFEDGYSTAYTVGVLFDSLDYAKTASEINIVDQIDGIPVTESGIEVCVDSTDTLNYDCYNVKVSEDTENLARRYHSYNSDDYDLKPEISEKIEKQIGANVEKVSIPDTIKFIPAECFANMTKLKSFTLPLNLKTLSFGVFENCSSLSSVTFKGTNVNKICDFTFKNCKSLKTIKFKENKIKTIGDYAFYNCKSLKKINLPSSLRSFGGSAFKRSGLECITIPKVAGSSRYFNEDTMGSAFRYCKSLKRVTFLSEKVFIPWDAFWGCDSLKEINLKKAKSINVLYSHTFSTKNKVIKFNTKNKKVAKSIAKSLKNKKIKNKFKRAKIYVGKKLIYNIVKK